MRQGKGNIKELGKYVKLQLNTFINAPTAEISQQPGEREHQSPVSLSFAWAVVSGQKDR